MRSLALLALLVPAAGAQATIHVPADYPTIQAGLDAAAPGDTVQVAPGTYQEHLQLREDVTLKGSGWKKTIVDGGGTGDVITSDGVHNFTLQGLAIRGAKATGGNLGAGILINGAACCTFGVTARIERCRVLDNGDGIRITNVHAGTLTLIRNIVDNNARHGVQVHIGTTILLRNTIVSNGGTGILATGGSGQVDARSNLIAFNGAEGLLRLPTTPTYIAYNDTFGNVAGGYMQLVSGVPTAFQPQPATGEINAEPFLVSLDNGDYHVAAGSPLIDAGDPSLGLDIDGSAPEIGAFPYDKFYVPANALYGTGCGPQAGWFWEAIVGQTWFETRVSQAPPGAPALLLVGVSATSWSGVPLPFDLGVFGAPGCVLLTGPIVTLSGATDAAGDGTIPFPIPADPVLAGATLRHQWAVVAPGANPLGMVFSDGVASVIKP